MRLHYAPGSAALARHATLAEIGAAYELVPVERDGPDEWSAAYRALNPCGRVPSLEDGDFVLTESAAICHYLAERFPEAGPVARGGHARAGGRLPLAAVVLEHCAGDPPATLVPAPVRQAGRQGAADAALPGHYDRIAAHLAGREWVVGDGRTVADLFLFMLTRWGRKLEPAAWDRPNLRAHFVRSLELRGPRVAIEEQGLELPAFAASDDG